jgi:AIPR protein
MPLVKVVNHLVDELKKNLDPGLSTDDVFELFVSDLITRDFGLGWDEIESGIVDGENDGQIDAIYVLVDEQILRDKKEFDKAATRRNAAIRVIVQQSKNRSAFEENPFAKMRASISDLFDSGRSLKLLNKVYNQDVISQVDLFRTVYLGLQGKNPSVSFDIVVASKGDKRTANARLKSDMNAIIKFLRSEYYHSDVVVRFLGARELIDLANRPRFINKILEFTAAPNTDNSNSGWVGLVRLDEFFKFIVGDDRRLLNVLLEENVRDFEGDKGVNNDIANTLSDHDKKIDFWWLNNGITVLCDGAVPHTPRTFSLDRPLIVNGLQTANMIWQNFARARKIKDERHILTKIIKSNDESVRDQIIRATNRQTPINPTQLKATEKLHRDIEAFFKTRGTFYERRKNQYKNFGKKKSQIFSINEVAQAVMSIVLIRPNDARARPSSLLRTEQGYELVFNDRTPLEVYAYCAELVRSIEQFLVQRTRSRKDRNNLKYYIAFVSARLMAGKEKPSLREFRALAEKQIQKRMLEVAYAYCRKRYTKLGGDDDVARGSMLIKRVQSGLKTLLKQNRSLRTR